MVPLLDDATWTALVSEDPGDSDRREAFANYAAERAPTSATLEDLYLAFRASSGDRRALALIEQRAFPNLKAALRRNGHGEQSIEDLLQSVREKLFVGDGEPKITRYSGKSSLSAWLEVVGLREGTSSLRKRTERVQDEPLADLPATGRGADPELAFLRKKFEGVFQDAFRAAAQELLPEERNVLRYHYVDRFSIDQIGRVYGLHRVSAARRIQKARERLLELTKTELGRHHFGSPSELLSVLRAVESAVDLSVRSVFR